MYKSLLYVPLLGALFGLAYSDFSCFFDKEQNIEDAIDSFFEDSDGDCESAVHKMLTQYRQAIKDCSVPITIDKMEILLEEMCDPNSELFKGLSQNAMCLSLASQNKESCLPTKNDLDTTLSVKESCEKMRDGYYVCLGDLFKPCGTDSYKAMKRIYKTRRTLTEGMCDEIAKIVDPPSSISKSSISTYSTESYSWMYWIFGIAVILSIVLTIIKKVVIKNLDEKPFSV